MPWTHLATLKTISLIHATDTQPHSQMHTAREHSPSCGVLEWQTCQPLCTHCANLRLLRLDTTWPAAQTGCRAHSSWDVCGSAQRENEKGLTAQVGLWRGLWICIKGNDWMYEGIETDAHESASSEMIGIRVVIRRV